MSNIGSLLCLMTDSRFPPLYIHTTPLREAEDAGDCLTGASSPFTLWVSLLSRYKVKPLLFRKRLAVHWFTDDFPKPTLIPSRANRFPPLEAFAKARVVYSFVEGCFVIYVSAGMMSKPSILRRLPAEFGLPPATCRYRPEPETIEKLAEQTEHSLDHCGRIMHRAVDLITNRNVEEARSIVLELYASRTLAIADDVQDVARL
jgi:hypothetical protein